MLNRYRAGDFEGKSPLERLVARSRLIGGEESLVLWGGGNTSTKVRETDPWGRARTVLRIKGSGADLKAVAAKNFSGLYLDLLEPLLAREAMDDAEMVEFISRCFVEPDSSRPSIETLLHAFVPHPCVDHTHADACLALVNNPRGEALAREVWGDSILWIPYRRPGFALSKAVGLAARANPGATAAVLANHGLITFGATDEESYARHIEMISRAESRLAARRKKVTGEAGIPREPLAVERQAALLDGLLPRLRGELSKRKPVVLRFTAQPADPSLDALLGHPALPALNAAGPATPDHTLHVRGAHCLVETPDLASPGALWNSVAAALEKFRADYGAYFARHSDGAHGGLDADPRVFLLPGLGLVTAGKTARAARVAADIVRHWAWIALHAEAAGGYRSLSEADKFAVEYWPLELYKLTLAPPGGPLARRVVLVTGAAGAIGAATAKRLHEAGACVVLSDLDGPGLRQAAAALADTDRVALAPGDLNDPGAAEKILHHAIVRFGGVDGLVHCAGVGKSAPLAELSDGDWERTFAVNAVAPFRLARALLRLAAAQGTGGAWVFVVTKNVFAPGREFAAYSASKAAQLQLARVAAMEGAALGVRVNAVNPDAVFENSKLWAEVGPGRAAAHGVAPGELPGFYAQRNLLKTRVTAADVAEAVLWLLSDAAAKTTGAVIPVDGGLPEAFPR